jgi:hypothetical protein
MIKVTVTIDAEWWYTPEMGQVRSQRLIIENEGTFRHLTFGHIFDQDLQKAIDKLIEGLETKREERTK